MKNLTQNNQELLNEISSVLLSEEEILEKLKNPPSKGLFNESNKEKLNMLSQEQNILSEQTKKLRQSLETFSRKSTAIEPDSFMNLDFAGTEMKNSSSQLSNEDTPNALESERKALEYLQNGQQGLQSASQKMASQQNKAGNPIGSPIQKRSGGMTGFHTAPVELPKADEYKPPKEFRQEILEALKEKYPLQYEKIIKEYYRRLTE